MSGCWFEALRPLCEGIRADARSEHPPDVVLFYVARWCQKQARTPEPRVDAFEQAKLRDTARRIARHLAEHGALVERLVRRDPEAWTRLRDELLESARPRAGSAAEDYAEEALEKITRVLLTGTSPSRASERLREGPRGPGNEYVFDSPFLLWARTVVINLIKDGGRARERGRTARPTRARRAATYLDRALLERACAALPGLLDAVRGLPPQQRSVLVLSLARRDLDEVVRERLHELAPDLFSEAAGALVSSDRDIAERLGTTPRRVAANRSAARRKLACRDQLWVLLLDAFMPHRSTRPAAVEPES